MMFSSLRANRRCPFLFVPAAEAAVSALRRAQLLAEVQRKTPARQGRTRLRQFVCPGQSVQEKGEDAKSNGETAANFVYCYKIAQNRSVLLEMTGAKC